MATPGVVLAVSMNMMSTAPTTIDDFHAPGTQPLGLIEPIENAGRCDSCHGGYDSIHEPFAPWAASMMAQASHDPIFRASLAIANQDAAFSGDLCLRCHTPNGWLEGRSTPTDGSLMSGVDLEGVNCNFCHRMVDPDHTAGVDPAVDVLLLAELDEVPATPHSGQYVIDPLDRRRGPFDLEGFRRHEWLISPFHSSSQMCATCHDVSNPVFERQPDGTYMPGTLGAPPASHSPYDQFPVERTYSEWLASAFAAGPIDLGGRFGGNKIAVSTCQDCHMPDSTGRGARNGEPRTDLPTHFLNGGSTWMLDAVRSLHSDDVTYLSDQSVSDSKQRTVDLLAAASDTTLSQAGSDLVVRVTNYSGHKLPTGYPEGRRMWLNVRFLDSSGGLIEEFGAYDEASATLDTASTKVYEAKLGISPALGAALGVPSGESFHFALNNEWLKDNRIPPIGYERVAFEDVQAAPVAYSYADGQHWDETSFAIPPGATRAEARLYYQSASREYIQSASREYIEFLRSENRTDGTGQALYDAWLATGMGAPVLTNEAAIDVSAPNCPPDLTSDGILDIDDVLTFLDAFASGDPAADLTSDGTLDIDDVLAFLDAFASGCP